MLDAAAGRAPRSAGPHPARVVWREESAPREASPGGGVERHRFRARRAASGLPRAQERKRTVAPYPATVLHGLPRSSAGRARSFEGGARAICWNELPLVSLFGLVDRVEHAPVADQLHPHLVPARADVGDLEELDVR